MSYLGIPLLGGAHQLLLASCRGIATSFRPPVAAAGEAAFESVSPVLEQHLQLDGEIDQRLGDIIGETESSAMAVMDQVRRLHDTASGLVTYLDGTSAEAGELGKGIAQSGASLVGIGAFLEGLPAKMERDMHNVQTVVSEIQELSGLTDAVRAISMQSHLLAINAAIEASRAGSGGAAFRVVADEMRALASNSGAVALKINQGLARARQAVEQGMATSIKESAKQLEDVSTASSSIGKLRDNFNGMSQYFNNRFSVVTEHNQALVSEIADLLGQMQTQDVVRQRIERIRAVMSRRNDLLQDAVSGLTGRDGGYAGQLPEQLELAMHHYLAEEEKHRGAVQDAPSSSGELKIELF